MPIGGVAAATIILEQPSTFERKGGLVYVRNDSVGVTFAFRRHDFLATFHNAAKCVQECAASEGAEIIELPVVRSA